MEDRGQFSVVDYSFFVVVFVSSAVIGLYYALKGRTKDSTIDEYLLGGRNMSLMPVACSVIATCTSGSTIVRLASEAEAYAYGTYSWMHIIGVFFMAVVTPSLFLPVFHELKLTSSFKYFELRFNRKVRLMASGLFLFTGLIYLPVTVYIPALTFQRVTGINIYTTVVILSVLCASYTALGGFKAVVWTDVVQLFLIIASIVIIITVGVMSAGGVNNVVYAADRGGRIVIMNTHNLNSRTAFLPFFISNAFVSSYQFDLSQVNLQRYLSLSNLKKMHTAVWILVVVFSIIICLTQVLGAVVYANYETCDPVKAGIIQKIDQILPHFIQDKASLFLGFNGIFVAGIFSASLSTTSSDLNAMSGIIYEDFISLRYRNVSDQKANKIMKLIVLILGIVQISLVFLVERMGMITQMTNQCMALNTTAIITLFILGVLVPNANVKGAMAGAFASVASLLILIIGSLHNKPEQTLPFRTDVCEDPIFGKQLNSTLLHLTGTNSENTSSDIYSLFKLNFVYYGFIGSMAGIIVGCLTSWFTGGVRVENEKLLAPFLRKILNQEDLLLKRKNSCD